VRRSAARLLNQLLDYRDSQDAVIMANSGDTLAGNSPVWTINICCWKRHLGNSPIDRAGIRAVIFNPTLTNSESLKGEGGPCFAC